MCKRVFDVIVAAFGLVILAPLLAVLAVVVRCSSPGPVLFRQTRVGRGGRPFVLFKFRTMRVASHADQQQFEAGGSPRVTPPGRVLRKSKLDELPQLWNVLKGDLSLVGPRPEVSQWVAAYPERWARVLRVRPGITDPASIRYRSEEEFLARWPDPEDAYRNVVLPHKLDLYEEYVRTQSVRGDLRILFMTLWAVAKGAARPCGETP